MVKVMDLIGMPVTANVTDDKYLNIKVGGLANFWSRMKQLILSKFLAAVQWFADKILGWFLKGINLNPNLKP